MSSHELFGGFVMKAIAFGFPKLGEKREFKKHVFD